MDALYTFLSYIIGINGLTFVLMAADKHKAKNNKWRIPERTLWLLSIFGGASGSFLGMRAFRHKTKQPPFIIGMPLLVVLHFFLILYLFSKVS